MKCMKLSVVITIMAAATLIAPSQAQASSCIVTTSSTQITGRCNGANIRLKAGLDNNGSYAGKIGRFSAFVAPALSGGGFFGEVYGQGISITPGLDGSGAYGRIGNTDFSISRALSGPGWTGTMGGDFIGFTPTGQRGQWRMKGGYLAAALVPYLNSVS